MLTEKQVEALELLARAYEKGIVGLPAYSTLDVHLDRPSHINLVLNASVMGQLKKKGLVELFRPDGLKFNVWRLTEEGRALTGVEE